MILLLLIRTSSLMSRFSFHSPLLVAVVTVIVSSCWYKSCISVDAFQSSTPLSFLQATPMTYTYSTIIRSNQLHHRHHYYTSNNQQQATRSSTRNSQQQQQTQLYFWKNILKDDTENIIKVIAPETITTTTAIDKNTNNNQKKKKNSTETNSNEQEAPTESFQLNDVAAYFSKFMVPFFTDVNNTVITSSIIITTTKEDDSNNENSIAKPFQKYIIKENDLSTEAFGPLLPFAERVDEWTGGWGLFYADLAPETTTSPLGVTFLLTNLAYAVAGFLLTIKGEILFGTMTEIAGGVSFWYHYSQLKYSGQEKNVSVRLALLTDYIFAGSALITGGIYAVILGPVSLPIEGLLSAIAAVLCLSLSWVYEFGAPYIFWHSMWHLLSALTGYLIGQAHIDNIITTTASIATDATISNLLTLLLAS